MLFIDIKILSDEDITKIKKDLEKLDTGSSGSPLITDNTVETLGKLSLVEFNSMMTELRETFLCLQTPAGQTVLKNTFEPK